MAKKFKVLPLAEKDKSLKDTGALTASRLSWALVFAGMGCLGFRV